MKAGGGLETQLHSFLIATLHNPEKGLQFPSNRKMNGPQG
jgi:hypothetical protein